MFNFDNSLLSDFAKCEVCALVKHVHGRQSRGKKMYADLGNCGHAGLEVHFNGGSRKQVVDKFVENYDLVVPPGQAPEDPAHTKENLTTILDRYCEARPVEKMPFEVVETEKMSGVEIADGYKFWMKRDMLVREKDSGLQVPVDHKFRFGQINEWWVKKYRLSSQFSGYIWGTQQATGEPIDHLHVNAISFGKLPDSNRKCKVHKVPYVECRRLHAQFEFFTFARTPEQIEKWHRDAIFLAKQAKTYFEAFGGSVELLPHALRRGTFNESCTFCEFADWCRIGFAPGAMDELTVYQPWKPWEEGEKLRVSDAVPVAEERQAVKYRWIYDSEKDKIAVLLGDVRVPGFVQEIPEPMALKKIWDKGKEEWMRVWRQWPDVQEAMAEFARAKEGVG